MLDGRAFNTNSRQPEYPESDGSISHLTSYSPLQSDITTAVSLAATVTRVAGGWWSGGYIWRCIFLSMERGGISLKGLSRVVSNMPATRRHFARRSNMVIIFITLFATYAVDYFSSALTGSIVWEPTFRHIPGRIPVTGIMRGVNGTDMTSYFKYPDLQTSVMETGAASANLAWIALQRNSANITEPSSTFRRVVINTQYLSTNSTLKNVTVPYFAVDAFEWITDPDLFLTTRQQSLLEDYSTFSPYFSGRGAVGLLPDSQWALQTVDKLGDPQIVAESRLLSYRIWRRPWAEGPCLRNYAIDPGSQINFHEYPHTGVWYDCFAIANVTYRAGAAICQDCRLISPTVVQAEDSIQIIPDSFTSMALGLAPSLSTYLIFSGFAVPQNYGTHRNFVIELTSRAYQAAWGAYSDGFGSQEGDTAVQIAVPTLRAKVIPWRVFLWVGLHFSIIALGLLFVYIQSRCDHPWVEDPTLAVFWLDTSAVSHGSDIHSTDTEKSEAGLRRDEMLVLENAGHPSRLVMSVKLKSG